MRGIAHEKTEQQRDELRRQLDEAQADASDELLEASRGVEARSHWNNKIYGYVVAKGAMDKLCAAILLATKQKGRRK